MTMSPAGQKVGEHSALALVSQNDPVSFFILQWLHLSLLANASPQRSDEKVFQISTSPSPFQEKQNPNKQNWLSSTIYGVANTFTEQLRQGRQGVRSVSSFNWLRNMGFFIQQAMGRLLEAPEQEIIYKAGFRLSNFLTASHTKKYI